MNGKGDKPRPMSVSRTEYARNYMKIDFGRTPVKRVKFEKLYPQLNLAEKKRLHKRISIAIEDYVFRPPLEKAMK